MKLSNFQLKRGHVFPLCAAAAACVMAMPTDATAREVMKDRCSSHVFIPTTGYNAKPDTVGTVVLTRPKTGYSPWTPPFTVKTDGSGRIRWWCASTKGNAFDLGTYRFDIDWAKALQCSAVVVGKLISGKEPDEGDLECVTGSVDPVAGASEYKGMTPERSRCGNRSNYVRARLGPNRLLQIDCLRPFGAAVEPRKTGGNPFVSASLAPELAYLKDLSCAEIRARDWTKEPVRPVVNWWSATRRDNAAVIDPRWIACPGEWRGSYGFHRIDGFIFSPDRPQPDGTVPIYSFWNHERTDNLLTGHPNFAAPGANQVGGYARFKLAGYAFAPETVETEGLVKLHTWYNPRTSDGHTTTHPHWDPAAGHPGTGRYNHFNFDGYLISADGSR